MRVALLTTKRSARAKYLLECFAAGAKKHGDACEHVDNLKTFDAASYDLGVFVCLPNFHHQGHRSFNAERTSAWNKLKAIKKRALVIDTGFVKNQYDYELLCRVKPDRHRFHTDAPETFAAVDDTIHYELAFEGIKGFGDHCTTSLTPADRWAKLGTIIKPWHRGGGHIALLVQPLHGQSSQGHNIYHWYSSVFRQLLAKGCRLPIVARGHPRTEDPRMVDFKTQRRAIADRLGKGQKLTWSKDLELDAVLKDAALAIAFSTSAAVTAVLEGVPVLVGSRACMAAPVAALTAAEALESLRLQRHVDRRLWANQLAYSQWNCAELKSGEAWAHYRPHALAPRKGRYK